MNKTILFLLGVVVVGVGALVAVYLGAIPGVELPRLTQLTTSTAPEKKVDTAAQPSATDAGKAETAAAGSNKAGTSAPDTVEAGGKKVVIPSFDVLRVEPSGSLVVAGRAAPNSKVDIIAGATPVGSTKAAANGDFAAVLDKALKPGDHQLVLRATSPDGTAATSTETAVVSIPETENGQVLALVEKPGQPSRLITKPKATETGGTTTAPATATADKVASAPAGQTGEKTAAATPDTPAKADAGTADGQATTAKEPRDAAAPEEKTASSALDAADKTAATTEPKTAAAEATQQSGKSGDQAEKPFVSVEAVEIEGSHIYVAGQATVGKRVLVYANDSLLGASDVSKGGRFLVEAEHDLAVGDYIIRADLVDGEGMKVIARAAVPFTREAGNRVAAVAPSVKAAGEAAAEKQEPAGTKANGAESGAVTPPLPKASESIASTPPVIASTEEGKTAEGDKTKLGAPLEEVKGSVIIRRGDTLWRIADRVYGRGVRYTTIYLANKDQIRDPDKIWPGQVFTMPQKSIPDSEALKIHEETH